MYVNNYLTNLFHLSEYEKLKNAPFLIVDYYDFDYKVYLWYVANFTNTILIKEYENELEEYEYDNNNEKKIAQLVDLRNMHYGIYELVNILFYEKNYDKYNISNKIHIKSGTLKYYYELNESNGFNEKIINKKTHIMIDYYKFQNEVEKIKKIVFYKKMLDKIFCF